MDIASDQRVTTHYRRAAAIVTELVGRIPDDSWDDRALGGWDLRALVGHTSRALSTVSTYLAQPADSEELPSAESYYVAAAQVSPRSAAIDERARQAGIDLGSDPAGTFALIARGALDAVSATDSSAVVTTIAGGMRVEAYLPTRTFELVVHGLDIAHATTLTVDFPVEVMTEVTSLAARVAAALGEGPTVLRALTGRMSLPPGFSVTA